MCAKGHNFHPAVSRGKNVALRSLKILVGDSKRNNPKVT
jgi:hypothetical protein